MDITLRECSNQHVKQAQNTNKRTSPPPTSMKLQITKFTDMRKFFSFIFKMINIMKSTFLFLIRKG
ncbi:hypothetical protein T4B_9149 [Trichinella pseudospiralis]|uniref:Uncharacterized protein n=2 Tax=Trichinella pseudospiralis TaxID=6337 RepID=A0A0V1EQI6_TRIPS|nr:hypothetical protein T4A_6773 [Trichinella pseudospiralis]KRY89961.1 hypothetical protein T4D_84 [Trichinella pseudospiralis]KRZ23299.1 hypothetical protein T4B_9149 [Trichinella pseudospiralis]KRZ28713.1 hypothetical protein T4C_1200 [Trichinella pseudospiralis]